MDMKIDNTVFTVIIVSPRVKSQEKKEVFDKVHRLSEERAIVVSDINDQHTIWDTMSSPRGVRLARWAKTRGGDKWS